MKKQKEDQIFIGAFIGQIRNENIGHYNKIKTEGFTGIIFEDKIVIVYNTYLLELLTTEKLDVMVLDTGKYITINGIDYQKDYVKGYFEGREYFELKFPKDEFFKDPKSYIDDLRHNYNNAKLPFSVIAKGWKTAKEDGSITYFNHIMIDKNAFKAGILSKLEELKEIRPSVFQNFDNLKPDKDTKPLIYTLEEACGGNETKKYKDIKAWFIQNNLCDPDTFIWKGTVTELANYLKDLHLKGYTEYLSQIQILSIANNNFGTPFSLSALNKAKGNHYTKILPELDSFKN